MYDPLSGNFLPADLQKTDVASAAVAASTSKDSYTKTIKMSLVKGKTYKFWFKYKYEDPETKEITLSDSSPIWKETFAIPNLTKGVLNLTLTAGYKSYGVKFDLDPLSVQEDIVIYESLTSTSLGNEVYRGTSTNVTIPTNSIATRWITVRTRDKWDDLNKTDTGPLSVTPLNPDPDTTYTVDNPATASAAASIDPKDLSGFSLVSTITWSQSINPKTAGYAIRWSTNNPDTAGVTPLWEYASVSGIDTLSFTATGLIPNTTYYYQVAGVTPYDVVDWTGITTRTFIASDADGTAAGALARLKSFIAIGGATQDLFKIGTGISQSINLNTDPLVTPTLTAGTYHGIVLNKSTTNVGNNFWLTTGQFRVGNPTEFMYWNGTNLYLTGNINATGGNFTGNVKLNGGTLFAGASPDSGQRVRLNSSGVFAYNSAGTQTFSLDTAGYLNSTSGLIGGWNLGATTLSNNGVVLDSANGQISVGSAPSNSVYLSSTGNYRIWAGSQSPTDAAAKFKIGSDGTLYATGAVIGLGAGSTIDGYATTSALNSYTLTSVTSGINSRLLSVEGNYVNVSTLNSSVATKNTTFVTTDSTQPYANKAGDLWINGGDNNSIWTANSAGYNWTEKTNGKYATTTQLSTKLSAGGYAIAAQDGQITNITSNGIFITPGTFKISNTNESAPYSGSYVLLNSAGMTAYDGSKTTFAISASGSATFSGALSAATGTFEGRLFVNNDTGYIDTAGTKSVNGVGVTTLVVKALGFQSTTNSGWTTTTYPWTEGLFSLGSSSYSWYRLYMEDDAYFGNGTTYQISSTGDSFMNGYAVSGGYGVYSHWAPRSDNTYDLGGWSLSSTGIQQNKRWRQIYSNNSTITTSDIRLKTDISNSELGLAFINKLRPVTYRWIEGSREPVFEDKVIKHMGIDSVSVEKTDIVKTQKISGKDEDGNDIYESISIPGKRIHAGFLAQEVKQVLDELEVEDFGGWVSDNIEDPEAIQSLRYEQFVAPLTKAVQELSDMVESLQQEINILKGI
jgi:hypothetical protein